MPRGKETKGNCAYCGDEIAKRSVENHLTKCAQRQAVLKKAGGKKTVETETIYHLRVQDFYGKEFWLDLEMRGSATLKHLDSYLRAIWLECCGHLSRFSIGSGWKGVEIAMSRKAEEVFESGFELTHIYDYGTSSLTLIKALSARDDYPTTSRPIALLARNVMPEVECMVCGKPAGWLCLECVIEHEKPGTLCEKHANNHPHDDYGEPVEFVNSPRFGMCGYTGPAEPPY